MREPPNNLGSPNRVLPAPSTRLRPLFAKAFPGEKDPITYDNFGKAVGAFAILKEIGHGGMGTVYLAARKVGEKEQRVALKLLNREMNTEMLRSVRSCSAAPEMTSGSGPSAW